MIGELVTVVASSDRSIDSKDLKSCITNMRHAVSGSTLEFDKYLGDIEKGGKNAQFDILEWWKGMNQLDDPIPSYCWSRGRGASRVVCVTSGGTTVPLEKRCAGYSVIFLSRRGTCQPFCRSLPEDPLLECFEVSKELNVRVCQSHSEAVRTAIGEHCAVWIITMHI
ncbi:hypothetical protein HYC85_020148 [Camellia sinensis]|uniref:DNA/pantothenate metabolism flavoprotein C-terminal domain-containing protein n=1 Tax=Camellia sinensis TaxID=4442 RepID=A0A7J7GSM7_CAMSI|nr:hypothetical protein HYC85_020148 [Camellia sinensis]